MMNSRRFVTGTAFLAVLFATASCNSESAGPGAGDGFIRGTVTAAKTGEGVPNLVVALVREGSVVGSAATDAAGRFAFPRESAGSYTARLIGLELTSFRPNAVALEPPSLTFQLASEPVDLIFAVVGLVPPNVSGYVTCNGQAIEGARIHVVGGESNVTVLTNAQGKYGATDLGAGYHAVLLESAPCAIAETVEVVNLRPGQGAEVSFAG